MSESQCVINKGHPLWLYYRYIIPYKIKLHTNKFQLVAIRKTNAHIYNAIEEIESHARAFFEVENSTNVANAKKYIIAYGPIDLEVCGLWSYLVSTYVPAIIR